MLKKEFKLPIQSFPKNSSKTIKGKFLLLKIIDNQKDYSRFNTIISSKYNKKATQRNILKRAIFNTLRLNWDLILFKKDVLIIINSQIAKESNIEDITKELLKLVFTIK